uniref:NADH dehydrogenase [ubiquinone] 1 alpha subcomplex subunit 7 n=1 Tax=Ciona savignyi TaxID=51511 RepID=H2Y9T5_CIOSA
MSKQSPIISMLTKYLGVRRNKMWLRYKDDMSPRTIPKPNMPPGSSSKLSNNYYYTRDARREIAPPVVLSSNITTQIAAGEAPSATPSVKLPTPGFPTKWSLSTDQPYLRK